MQWENCTCKPDPGHTSDEVGIRVNSCVARWTGTVSGSGPAYVSCAAGEKLFGCGNTGLWDQSWPHDADTCAVWDTVGGAGVAVSGYALCCKYTS